MAIHVELATELEAGAARKILSVWNILLQAKKQYTKYLKPNIYWLFKSK